MPNKIKAIPAIFQQVIMILKILGFAYCFKVKGNNIAPMPVIPYRTDMKSPSTKGYLVKELVIRSSLKVENN